MLSALNPEHPPPKRRRHVDKEENVEAFSLRKRITIFNGHAPDCPCILPASGRRQRGLGATNGTSDLGLDLCNGVGASSSFFVQFASKSPDQDAQELARPIPSQPQPRAGGNTRGSRLSIFQFRRCVAELLAVGTVRI
jgi:hypothetical protein